MASLRKVICVNLPKKGAWAQIPEKEAQHLTQVLRLRSGDLIEAIDGKGKSVVGWLRFRDQGAFIEAQNDPTITEKENSILPLVLEIAVLKSEAMEWVIEKAVELGVKKLVPIEMDFSVVQTAKKGPKVFQERWQKIADQALKQCGRLESMPVLEPISFKEYYSRPENRNAFSRWIAFEKAKDTAPHLTKVLREFSLKTTSNDLQLLIGPEGGFSPSEIDLLSEIGTAVSLGNLILRAETAALFAVSLMHSLDKSS